MDADDFKAAAPVKEIKDGKIVESNDNKPDDILEEAEVMMGGNKRPKKAEAVRSAPPKKKDKEDKK